MELILSKPLLYFKPYWDVLSYSGVLYRFRRKSPKTTIMGPNVANSKIISELMEMKFFRQTRETGQILLKTVFLHYILCLAFQVCILPEID